jgi:hypothetical protein
MRAGMNVSKFRHLTACLPIPRVLALIQLFRKRHPEVVNQIAPNDASFIGYAERRLATVCNKEKLERILAYMLDENEFRDTPRWQGRQSHIRPILALSSTRHRFYRRTRLRVAFDVEDVSLFAAVAETLWAVLIGHQPVCKGMLSDLITATDRTLFGLLHDIGCECSPTKGKGYESCAYSCSKTANMCH